MGSTIDGKLTEQEMQKILASYAESKDADLKEKVVFQYKQLVESIARRFAGSGEPVEDLIQEGYIGLLTATDLYDSEKGVKFSTYATHFIVGQIKHALRDRGKIIKEPAWLQELNHRMTRVMDGLYQELGRPPTDAEIGRVMHLPEETIAELLTTREILKVTSLDNNDQEESSSGGVDLDRVKDDKHTMFQLPVEDRIVLETAMNKLKIIEQKVINEFYYSGLSQTEIARKMGISCNYVSHILRNGTRKLRRILTTEDIREAQMQLQLANRRPETIRAEVSADVIDTVTGTYTREYVEARLAEELIRAARDKTEVVFALISLNEMDLLASTYGAMRRDNAVCGLAQLIKSHVRKCDIVGRVGANEFGVIMLHTKQHESQICQRLQQTISKAQFDLEFHNAVWNFQADVTFAVYPMDSVNALDLIGIAQERQSQLSQLPKAA